MGSRNKPRSFVIAAVPNLYAEKKLGSKMNNRSPLLRIALSLLCRAKRLERESKSCNKNMIRLVISIDDDLVWLSLLPWRANIVTCRG